MRFRIQTLTLALLATLCIPASLLAQSGTITGVVRTSNGAPFAGIRVTALPAGNTDDRLRSMSSLAITDEAGRYRLENVPPGRYHIGVGRVDLPTFYPGTLDIAKATIVSVTSAATITDIDVVIDDINGALPPAGGRGGRGGARGGGLGGRGGPAAPFTVPPAPVAPPAPQPAPGLQGRGRGGVAVNLNRGAVVLDNLVVSPPSNAAWWTNRSLVARLGLTDDQMRKIETIFEQHRSTLAQNKAALEREEATLARMLEMEPLESAKAVQSQIERVIQSRAEMERNNSRMTLEMRQVLTRSQWVQLQAETQPPATNTFGVRGRGGVQVVPTPLNPFTPAVP